DMTAVSGDRGCRHGQPRPDASGRSRLDHRTEWCVRDQDPVPRCREPAPDATTLFRGGQGPSAPRLARRLWSTTVVEIRVSWGATTSRPGAELSRCSHAAPIDGTL